MFYILLNIIYIVQGLSQTREEKTAPLWRERPHLIAPLPLCKFASTYTAAKVQELHLTDKVVLSVLT